jgi:hypothetical protein
MALLSKSPSPFIALGYVTLGALIEAWSLIWYLWMNRNPAEHESAYFYCYGLLATGAILFCLGLSFGVIGRAARQAELPPAEVTPAVAQATQNMAARAPIAPMVPAGTAGMAVPVATNASVPPVGAASGNGTI